MKKNNTIVILPFFLISFCIFLGINQTLAATEVNIPSDYAFEKNLQIGDTGKDVQYLQEYLKYHKDIYPEGLVTGYFGTMTQNAVKKLQEKYSKDILSPSGLIRGTGSVGPATRIKLNTLDEDNPKTPLFKSIDPKPTEEEFKKSIPPKTSSPIKEIYKSSSSDGSKVLATTEGSSNQKLISLIVNASIKDAISDSLNQYIKDLENEGYKVSMATMDGGTPQDLRNYLKTKYLEGLTGSVLIGNLAVPWYEMNNDFGNTYSFFPMDLYYMDLEGEWLDSDSDQKFDSRMPVGNEGPEIWIGRLTANTLAANTTEEINLLKNYFRKNHAYRTGALSLKYGALAYPDDDWYFMGGMDLNSAYDQLTIINDKYQTNASDYKNQLNTPYEFIHVRVHSGSTKHVFSTPSGTGEVYNYDIKQIDPKAFFYNLNACESARYTADNYLAGWYIFGNSYGLLALGNTKVGGMADFADFYKPLGEGKNLGEAYKDWWLKRAPYDLNDYQWYGGMTMLGDPTLKISKTIAKITYPPSVATEPATNIFDKKAQLNGILSSLGGNVMAEVWFEYGSTLNYGSTTEHQIKTATGTVSAQISNLINGRTYHFRAVAQNSAGISYGENKTFTGLSGTFFSTVVSPNGGEKWETGETYPIKWQTGIFEKVKIEIIDYTYSSTVKKIIADGVSAQSGSYLWTVPQDIFSSGWKSGDNFKISISASMGANTPEIKDQSDNYFTITLKTPDFCTDTDDGQDYYTKGKISGYLFGTYLEYYDSCILNNSKVNSCSGTGCFLKEYYCGGDIIQWATSTCAFGCQDGVCLKTNPITASIKITSPNGGEKWEIGKTYNILWTSSGMEATDEVKISLLKNEIGFLDINSSATNSGTFAWTIPADITPGDYKIEISPIKIGGLSLSTITTKDSSDNNFGIIAAPSVCTESDSGKIYYSKGTCTDKYGTSRTDICLCDISFYQNLCLYYSSYKNKLTEYYCDSTGACKSEIYTCSSGCKEGACQKEATPATSTPSSVCTDYDGGKMYYTKGRITGYLFGTYFDTYDYCSLNGKKVDYCLGYGCYLNEYYCYNSAIQKGTYYCSSGCKDGACMAKVTTTMENVENQLADVSSIMLDLLEAMEKLAR